MPEDRDTRALALAAAQQASAALAELVRHAAEGPGGLRGEPFSQEGEDTAELLADALKLTMEIEGDELAETERGQLYTALVNFLEGWR